MGTRLGVLQYISTYVNSRGQALSVQIEKPVEVQVLQGERKESRGREGGREEWVEEKKDRRDEGKREERRREEEGREEEGREGAKRKERRKKERITV